MVWAAVSGEWVMYCRARGHMMISNAKDFDEGKYKGYTYK
jgi:hypothetical protein